VTVAASLTHERHALDWPLVTEDVFPAAPQPLYEQVCRQLSEQIVSGIYRPGSRLPSERLLQSSLGVSRLTVRRALEELLKEGVVERAPRGSRGWFVASGPVSEPPNELVSFSAIAQARGLEPTARVLSANVRGATVDEAEHLMVAPGAPLFDLERLRMLDGIVISVERTRLPYARIPWITDVDFSTASLHAMLESHGIVPTTGSFLVDVLDADERLGELLEVPAGKGLLLSQGETFDQSGQPLELLWMAYRADRYRMRTTVGRVVPVGGTQVAHLADPSTFMPLPPPPPDV
jgi:GntR family transcriptional regulator